MNWEARWKIMDDLVNELKSKRESIPAKIMKDLRLAKTMVEILNVNTEKSENIMKLEEYLSNIEAYLIVAAKNRFGPKYAEDLTEKLIESQNSTEKGELMSIKAPMRFPKNKRWIRIQESEEVPLDKIKKLSEETGLSYRVQEKGYVLVYGEEKGVKKFVKKTAELFPKTNCEC